MRRLVDELGPSARRDVLSSAKDDERFRPEARARALAAGLEALGAVAAPGEGESSSLEAANRADEAANHAEPGPAGVESGGGAITSTLVKGVGKAVVAAVLTLGGVALVLAVSKHGASTEQAPLASAAPLREPEEGTSPTPWSPPTPPASAGSDLASPSHSSDVPRSAPSRGAFAAAPRVRTPSDASPTEGDDVLAREVRTIGAARAALAAGDPALALRELDAYDRIPNAHTLRPESRVLRLESLAKAGREKEARALATTLRTEPEMAAYDRRIDAVLERFPSKEGVP